MKRIKIFEPALAANHLFPMALNKFKALKITREQALAYSFADQRSSYGVLRAKYAQEELKENELYDGYILFHDGLANRVAYLNGYFRKEAPEEILTFPVLRLFPQSGYTKGYWHRVYRIEDGKETLGDLKLVLTLGTLAFEKYLLQEEAEKLRQKLIKSVLEKVSIEITKNDETALKQILGDEYKKIVKNISIQRKKLKIIKENLIVNYISAGPCKKMVVIKLSEEQAMRFNLEDEEAEIDTLIAKYGQESVLQENEHYKGYALLSEGHSNQIITMDGHIASSVDELGQKVCNMCFVAENGKSEGYAKRIFTFGNFPFNLYCNEELAERTRSRIVEAAVSGNETEFKEDEMALLIRVFGYFKFFEITEELEEEIN